jgi:predicted transcriptional regulator
MARRMTMMIARHPYRDKYDIINDILRILSQASVIKLRHKSSIGYAVNLTHRQTVTYLNELIDHGFLRISYDNGPSGYFDITEKGRRYLELFAEIEDDLRLNKGVTS